MADEEKGALSQLGGTDITGVLSRLAQDPVDPNRGWLAYAAGALSPTRSGSSAEGFGNALAAMNKAQSEQEALRASYVPHVTQALIQAAQFQRQREIDNMLTSRLLRGGQPASPMPGQLGSGMYGDVAPPSGMPAIPQPTQSTGGGLANMSPDDVALFKYFGKDILPEYKMANEGFERKPGTFYDVPGKGREYIADPTKGFDVNPLTGEVKMMRNFDKVNAAIKGAETEAATQATNRNTIAKPGEYPIAGNGGKPMTLQQLTDIANGGASSQGAQEPSNGDLPQSFVQAIIGTESGGNPNAVSAKGAKGVMQVMDGTNKNPGYGVTPAKDNSPEERVRVGTDYLNAMHQRYGDPTLAAIAYNMGPDATDKWLAAGGDYNKLPGETKGYVSSVMTRKAVLDRQAANQGGVRLMSPAEVEADKIRQANAAKLETEPAVTSATDIAKGDVSNFKDYNANLNNRVRDGFSLVRRNQEMMSLLDQYQTGRLGSEGLLKLASTVQNMFPSDGRAKSIASKIAGGDVSAGQELQQLFAGAALNNLKQVLDGQGRINAAEYKNFTQNSEGLLTDPDALRKIAAFQNKIYGDDFSEQQALAEARNNGKFNPATWEAEYAKIAKSKLDSPQNQGGNKSNSTNSNLHAELPPASQYSGKLAIDRETGKKYKSNGQKWVEVH